MGRIVHGVVKPRWVLRFGVSVGIGLQKGGSCSAGVFLGCCDFRSSKCSNLVGGFKHGWIIFHFIYGMGCHPSH